MTTPWFALRTRARAERVVRDGLIGRGIEVFLPTVTRVRKWSDRAKAIDFPLFAGYCFVRARPEDRLALVTCPGVAGLVSFAGTPAPIPDHEINGIKALVTSDLDCHPTGFLADGDAVRVVNGPLAGVVGRLLRTEHQTRLILSVELIAQSVSVEVDAADVLPLRA